MEANLSNEFQQKYTQTFAKVKLPKDKVFRPVYITSSETHQDNTYSKFVVQIKQISNAMFGPSLPFAYEDLEFDFKFPVLGYRHLPGHGTIFVSRKADRQFKKGLCAATISYELSAMEFMSSITKSIAPYSICGNYIEAGNIKEVAIVDALYNPVFYSFLSILDKLHSDKTAKKPLLVLPVSPTWAISYSPNKHHDFLLFWENLPVGFIDHKPKASYFNVTIAELYRQEWVDFYNRTGLQNGTTKSF
jgi:hypothetical protein